MNSTAETMISYNLSVRRRTMISSQLETQQLHKENQNVGKISIKEEVEIYERI